MLTATGIGSGLDIEGLVNQLVAAERSPVESRLVRQESGLTAELSGFGSLKGALANFQSAFSSLSKLSSFGQRTASSSDGAIATISADGKAATGSYELGVSQLSAAHSLASGSYSSINDVVGTGTLTFRFGSTDYVGPDPGPESYNSFTLNPDRDVATITIDSSNNTLEGVRDAINDADMGVSAVIVNDGTGHRLLFSSETTGAENSIELRVDDTGDGDDLNTGGLSALAFNTDAHHLSQTIAAQDALFTINGLSLTSSENTVKDVIDGVDISLKDLTGSAPVTLTVAEDRASVKTTISGFVNAYNSFVGTVNSLTAYNAETGRAGALQGDFSARSITSQLRQVLTGAVEGFNGAFSSISEVGITTNADGSLTLDSSKLDDILETGFDKIAGLFAEAGFPSDNALSYLSATEDTVVGSYDVNITQLATQGQLQGSTISFASPVVIDADNDSFTLSVNGQASGEILLTQASYSSGAALAAELQSRINGDSALSEGGVRVSVTYETDHFEITSDTYGSESSVEIVTIDANTTAALGLSVAAGTSGVDVAGTIGGAVATGIGQILTGAESSDSDGLKLLIEGFVTGNRGEVGFSRGIAHQLNTLVGRFLESDGLLDARTDGIQNRVDDIADQREILNRRIEAVEARYRAQFNALDGLLAQLQSTSNFLGQQIESLPRSGILLNRS